MKMKERPLLGKSQGFGIHLDRKRREFFIGGGFFIQGSPEKLRHISLAEFMGKCANRAISGHFAVPYPLCRANQLSITDRSEPGRPFEGAIFHK